MLALFLKSHLCGARVHMEVIAQLDQGRAYVFGIADQVEQWAKHIQALKQAVLQGEQSVAALQLAFIEQVEHLAIGNQAVRMGFQVTGQAGLQQQDFSVQALAGGKC